MKKLLSLAFVMLLAVGTAAAQTPHGILVSWATPTIPTGGAALAGLNLFRATWSSSTSACGSYSQLNTAPLPGNSYLDPASGLAVSTEYCYYATTQDVNGNLSAASNIATTTTPAAWPVNPNPPSLTLKNQ
jgi:hypothetical protein